MDKQHHVEIVSVHGINPRVSKPAGVVSGDPVHTTWNLEDRGSITAGQWQSTPGKWTENYSEWEYVFIHSGHSILTNEDGLEVHLKAGSGYVIRPGFKGTWEVVETTLKDYVIVK